MIFIQKKMFRGRQEFRLQDDDHIFISFKTHGGERSFTIALAGLDPRSARIKTSAYGFLIAAVPTALFTAFMLLGVILQRTAAEVIQALIVTVVFGGISFLCFRENARKSTDIVTFYSRANGKPVLLPWYNNPNKAAFDTFITELTNRIKESIKRADETPRVFANTMAGEIMALKKLVDDGVLNGAEFERAKAKLLETAGEKRPIGFGG